MRQVQRTLRFGVVLAAALAGGWLYAQGQPVTQCGTTIDVPGHYELASDIGPCPGNGVTISANDVTFDLAGHSITGISSAASCNTGAPQIGINVSAADNVQIAGGTVRGFVDGIDFGASNSRVGAMSVTDNCVFGMVVSNATNVTLEANSVTGSGNDGLLLLNADEGTFQANDISSNGRFGVLLVSGSDHNTIRDNSLNGNGAPASGAGLGVVGGTDTQILRNTAQGNRLGITVHTGSNVVQGNIANANQTVGITIADVAGDNRVDGNTATGNGAFDLTDVNAHCGTNSWQNGVFSTDDVAGVSDGGPGAGCITGVTSLACVDGACPSDAKAVLLAQTGAEDVTGPLPELGRVREAVTVGEVTLEGRGLFVGVAGDPRVDGGDWTSLLAGPDIALTSRRKVLNIAFPVPVFTAGFDFVEPETGPNVGRRFSDTTFLLTLEREGVSLRQMAFNAPNDVAAFINVVSDVGFDKMVLSPLAAFRRADLAFGTKMLGNIYAGRMPVVARPYDAVVLDGNAGSRGVLFKVHPGDGFREILNDFAAGSQGTPGSEPSDVAVEKSRQILVVDGTAGTNNRGGLFRIDPVTRLRERIHDFGNPNQASQGTPLGLNPTGLAVEPTGHILVVDLAGGTPNPSRSRGALFRVNAMTNVRTLVNDFGATAQGPLVNTPRDVAVEASGRILVLDDVGGATLRGALFRVDPTTRKRTLLSDFGDDKTGEVGSGPQSIAVEAAGSILAIDQDGGTNRQGALYRIDPKNGFRTRLSDFGQLDQGPLGLSPTGVAVTPDGGILVVDFMTGFAEDGKLFLVDPVSGLRVLLSDFGLFEPSKNLGKNPRRVAILPH